MKITLTAERDEEKVAIGGRDSIELTDVKEYCVHGLRMEEVVRVANFQYWSGTFEFLIGRTYYILRALEREEQMRIQQAIAAQIAEQRRASRPGIVVPMRGKD
jgi:hypothetical protein